MAAKKLYNPHIIFTIVTFVAAITIISMTLGRDIYEGREQSILSFAIVHFSGYLFFLLMPVEMSFVYFLTYQENVFLIILIALSTAISAQMIDYFIGYSVSSKIINKYFGEGKSERAKEKIKKFGNLTIFLFNLLPLSSPIICLAAGMIKHPLKNVVLNSFAGLLLKYIALWIIFVL